MKRKQFLAQLSALSAGALCLPGNLSATLPEKESAFARHLQPIGRALELEGYYVWCNSPVL